jgi:putative oxidoreductase
MVAVSMRRTSATSSISEEYLIKMETKESQTTSSVTNALGTPRLDLALLLIRIASALAFLYHGSAILFGAFGGPGPQRFAAARHAPAVIGYLVGLAQVCGGLAMLTGIFIRLGAACIIIVMLGAIFLVHLPHGFDIGKGGLEYALTQLLIACAVLLTGPGKYSLSSPLPGRLQKL